MGESILGILNLDLSEFQMMGGEGRGVKER